MRKQRKKEFDFKPIGSAIRSAREDEGMTRENVAESVSLDPRYYAKIENDGQYPSFNVFYKLIRMFQISVDEHFFPNTDSMKTSKRRYIENLLDRLSEKDLHIIEGTAKGILSSKNDR